MANGKKKKKIMCLKRKKLVVQTPEEKVRQNELLRLTKQLGYSLVDIEVEQKIKLGAGNYKRADIAIFPLGKDHVQANISIIIECKREDASKTDKIDGTAQLESYIAASLNCKFGMWVGETRVTYQSVEKGGLRALDKIATLPRFGAGKAKPPKLKDLKPELSPTALLNTIHDYIHTNEGVNKDKAFHELVKLIECKRIDEATGDPLGFYAIPGESIAKIRTRIDKLFDAVKAQQPEYSTEKIDIPNDNVLRFIVANLQLCNLAKTPADLIGKAYETLIGTHLRGNKGQFWTPAVVVMATIELIWALEEKRARIDKLIQPGSANFIDPFCGTGRFPMYHLRKCMLELKQRGMDDGAVKDTIAKITTKSIHAVDIQPELVRAARSFISSGTSGAIANIGRNDSLQTQIAEWNINVTPGSFPLGATNPPFGDKLKIDDPKVLSTYELSRIGMGTDKHGNTKSRNSLSPEVMSVERCVDLLQPGGYFAMVLPDAITNTKSKDFVRQYLLENVELVACVDFPKETFEPGGTGTQTTVIIFHKPEDGQEPQNEGEIFMAILTSVGYNSRDETTFQTDEYGEKVLDSEGEQISDNQLPALIEAFRTHLGLGKAEHSLFDEYQG